MAKKTEGGAATEGGGKPGDDTAQKPREEYFTIVGVVICVSDFRELRTERTLDLVTWKLL